MAVRRANHYTKQVVQSKLFISYFSHYKPLGYFFSFLDYDNIGEDIDLQNQPQQDSAE